MIHLYEMDIHLLQSLLNWRLPTFFAFKLLGGDFELLVLGEKQSGDDFELLGMTLNCLKCHETAAIWNGRCLDEGT